MQLYNFIAIKQSSPYYREHALSLTIITVSAYSSNDPTSNMISFTRDYVRAHHGPLEITITVYPCYITLHVGHISVAASRRSDHLRIREFYVCTFRDERAQEDTHWFVHPSVCARVCVCVCNIETEEEIGERLELIGCKQTGVPGQEIHYFCPCVQASSHMSRHAPRSGNLTPILHHVVLPLLFPLPMPLGFFPLPSTSSHLYSFLDGNFPFSVALAISLFPSLSASLSFHHFLYLLLRI